MASKSSSVRSIRLSNELWSTIRADAERRGETVNAVISRHLRIAYAPKDRLTPEHIADVALASAVGARAMAAVNRPKVSVNVPLAGTFERKPYQKGQKK